MSPLVVEQVVHAMAEQARQFALQEVQAAKFSR